MVSLISADNFLSVLFSLQVKSWDAAIMRRLISVAVFVS